MNSEIEPAEAKEVLGLRLFLDVRENAEWATGRIQGAVHVPVMRFGPAALHGAELPGDILEQIEGHKNESIVVYCSHGIRSQGAAKALRKIGYTKAVSMRGGLTEWAKHGYPVER